MVRSAIDGGGGELGIAWRDRPSACLSIDRAIDVEAAAAVARDGSALRRQEFSRVSADGRAEIVGSRPP